MKRDNAQTGKRPSTRIQSAKNGKRTTTHTVSFRLDGGYLSKLENIGSKRGKSIHEQARSMVTALLDGDEAELFRMRDEITDLRAEVEAMRDGLEVVLVGLVHSVANAAGETLSIKEAQAFVAEAFRRKERAKDALHQ